MSSARPRIAILGGTGKEGSGLASRWAAAGYEIFIGSRSEERARQAAEIINQLLNTDLVSGYSNLEAAKLADICVITVHYSAHREAIESIKAALGGKIVVDATSRVDFRDPKPPEAPSAAQETQSILGAEGRVVAAFQSVPAKSLRRDIGQAMNTDVLICSDDIPAAEQVRQLAKAAGMNAYYAGPLANSNVVEGLTSILISLNKHYGVKDASIRVSGIPSESQRET